MIIRYIIPYKPSFGIFLTSVCKSVMPRRLSFGLSCIAYVCILASTMCYRDGWAQSVEAIKRLQQGADSIPASQYAKSEFRGGSSRPVIDNMRDLFAKVLAGGGDIDKWYSPHLRDTLFTAPLRMKQASFRSYAGVAIKKPCLVKLFPDQFQCFNGLGVPMTSCPLYGCQNPLCGNIPWPDEHKKVTPECCNLEATGGTRVYAAFQTDSNFKTCCVRPREVAWPEEKIACNHPLGDGWAGLFEYYFPTTAFGWENDRTTTMLATKEEVTNCLNETDKLMQNSNAARWVSSAIERNKRMADGAPPIGVTGAEALSKVTQDIADVRDIDDSLKFADSLQGEGLTVRWNEAALSPKHRLELAKHFCMHPLQFDKLMKPGLDLLHEEPAADQKLWANYCPNGVDLVTDPEKSAMLSNPDQTDTDFVLGTNAWRQDPLYCQRINARQNPNLLITGIKGVLDKTFRGQIMTPAQVGFTCSSNGSLNGGMVPVSMYRHAAVERRTAIADHALSFLMAAGLSPSLRSGALGGVFKRFEPRPYKSAIPAYVVFKGKPFKGSSGGPTNELVFSAFSKFSACQAPINGRNYREQETSDQLYISDFTHAAFTQEPIVNVNSVDAFDKYRQQWAKADAKSKQDLTKKGLDKYGSNYGTAFRKFATCPAGFVRWRLPGDPVLQANLELFCGEENFGSPMPH